MLRDWGLVSLALTVPIPYDRETFQGGRATRRSRSRARMEGQLPEDGREPVLGDRLQRGGDPGGRRRAGRVEPVPLAAVGALFMSLSTVVVAFQRTLHRAKLG